MIEIQWNPSRRDLRLFGLIGLPAVLLIAAAVVGFSSGGLGVAPLVLAGLAVVSMVVAVAAPGVLRPVSVGLSLLGYPMAWLVSHALLALIYFGVITPLGLLLRLGGRDPLRRSPDPARSSYWEDRPAGRTAESYFRQF